MLGVFSRGLSAQEGLLGSRLCSWGLSGGKGLSSRESSVLTLTGCPGQRASHSGAWLKCISQNHHMSLPEVPTLSSQAGTHWEEESKRRQDSSKPQGKGQCRVKRAANPNSPDVTGG